MGSLSSCEAPTNTGSVRLPNRLQRSTAAESVKVAGSALNLCASVFLSESVCDPRDYQESHCVDDSWWHECERNILPRCIWRNGAYQQKQHNEADPASRGDK